MKKVIWKMFLAILCVYFICGFILTAVSWSNQRKHVVRINHFYKGFVQIPASYIGIKLPNWWIIKWTRPFRD